MICKEVEELTGAYALAALPPDRLREVERHLSSCSKHPEIAELSAVARSLALAAPDAVPPSALKARIMDVVRRESGAARKVRADRGVIAWMKGVLTTRLALAPVLVGVLAVIAVALLVWNISLQTGGGGTIERPFTAANAARGSVTYIPDKGLAVLSVENMTRLPPNETYQVWTISDGVATGVGFLDVSDAGRGSSTIGAHLEDREIVAVTVEPAEGSAQPTTAPVLKAEF